jgi:hypothetical protein
MELGLRVPGATGGAEMHRERAPARIFTMPTRTRLHVV